MIVAGEDLSGGARPASRPSPNGRNGTAVPPPEDGRDAKGRFKKGWRGGPGNPFGRRVAALRTALLDAITPERIRELAARLHARAVAGDIPAAKLLLAYTVGEPGPAVDPDRVSVDEVDILLAAPALRDLTRKAGDRLAPDKMARVLRAMLADREDAYRRDREDRIGQLISDALTGEEGAEGAGQG
jgi:hypothetical protein